MKLDFEAIRRDNPIEEVIGQTVKLTKAGREYKGLCPFHNEKTPSFTVVPHKGFYHCMGCSAHGDVIDFVAETQGCSSTQAIEYLTGGNPLKLDPAKEDERKAVIAAREKQQRVEQMAAIAKAAAKWQSAKPSDPRHAYLVRKESAPHNARQDDSGDLLLPIYGANGELQSLQSIGIDGGKKFHPGAPTKHGRMHIGINMGRAIICEGFATGDAIYDAVPDQVIIAFSKSNIHNMARELHAAGKAFIIAADNNALAEMTALAAELSVPVIAPPSEYDDYNDLKVAKGSDAVAKAITTALRAHADNLLEQERLSATDETTGTGPVDLWRVPPPPALPRGFLPDIIERFAYARSEQLGTDPSGLAMAAIACCAGVLKDEIKIKPKRHEKWTESARLWVMLVGVPSSKKSPIISAATGRVKAIDTDMLRHGNFEYQKWLEDGGQKSGDSAPIRPRLRVGDITMEAAQEVCKESPDGVIAIQDELSGWFGSIEKYGGGKGSSADRSFWLQAFGGGSYAVNRIGRGSFLIDNLSVSILGGIQPDAIRRVMADATDDGLIQRFLPIVLGPAEMDKDVPIPPVSDEFDALIDTLRTLKPATSFFGDKPCVFDDEGQKIREQVRDRNDRLIKSMESINAKLSSHIGKFDGIFPRLCLLWHCVDHAMARDEAGWTVNVPETIPAATTRKVATFVERFIMRHSTSFYTSTLGLSDNQETVRAVAGHILTNSLENVTMRTLERGVRRLRIMKHREDRDRVMEHLVSFGWLIEVQKRSDAPSWNVLPEVHKMYAAQAETERENRAKLIDAVRDLEG